MGIAVAQAAAWGDRHGRKALRINLNFSPIQFGVGDLKRWLGRYHLPPSAICIEVAEGTFSDLHAVLTLGKACEMGSCPEAKFAAQGHNPGRIRTDVRVQATAYIRG